MEEATNQAQNEAVQSAPVEASPAPEVKSQNETPQEDKGGSVTPTEGNVEEQNAPETKPQEEIPQPRKQSRAERRIQQLTEKLKATQDSSQHDEARKFVNTPPPPQKLITQEEIESGGIDPEVLETRQKQREQTLRDQIKQEVFSELSQRNRYETMIRDSLNDLEQVQKKITDTKNQQLEELFTEQYELANYAINPMTGEKVFVPRVSASQLFDRMTSVLSGLVATRAAQARESITDRVSRSAVSSSSPVMEKGQKDYSNMTLEDIYKDPRAIAKAIEAKYGES